MFLNFQLNESKKDFDYQNYPIILYIRKTLIFSFPSSTFLIFLHEKIYSFEKQIRKSSSLTRGERSIRLITASSWIIRITSWTTHLDKPLDKRGSIHPPLLYPANFQHLHADTRIGSGFSFATAIQSCKSGVGWRY